MKKIQIRVLFNFLVLFTLSFTIHGATKTWNNLAGGSWATGTNWTPNGVPANNDDIVIPALTSAANTIQDIPTFTMNSLTFTGSGGCVLGANSSGDIITIRTTWTIPSGYTVTIGVPGGRAVITTSSTCNATFNGYCAFDAGSQNRNFTVNGTLTINSSGMLYDPNPTAGSDFYANAGAVLRTQKSQGFTTTSAPNAAGVNFNVAISFGGAYAYAAGVHYIYSGTGAQSTGAGLTQSTPASLTASLSSGQILTMSAATAISGSLILTSGLVNLNATTMTLGISAASPGTLNYTAGHLYNGSLSRWFTTTAVTIPNNAGLFPLGTSVGDYRPIWVGSSTNPSAAGIITAVHTATYPAALISASHADASAGFTVIGVSNAVWTLSSASVAIAASNFAVRYGGTGFGTNILANVDASLVSSVIGTHGAATNAVTTLEANRTGLSIANLANAWRLGTKNSAVSPLPVGLAEFKAVVQDKRVNLNWTTYTEKDNDFFTVEKSKNAIDYQTVGTLEGAGNSDYHRNYALCDEHPTDRLSYYRLRQTNFDGTSTLSPIIVVNFEGESSELEVYPNPNSGTVYFRSKAQTSPERVEVLTFDGKQVYFSDAVGSELDLSFLPTGMYLLNTTVSGRVSTHKLVLAQ